MINKLQILQALKLLLVQHFGDKIKEVILFGSQAKGTANKFSDYDVLVILTGDYDWKLRDQITDIMYDLELKYDILFDKHLISVCEINNSLRGAEPIYVNAIKNGVYA